MAFPFYGADGTNGTVAVSNGSPTVTGTGTNWLSNNAVPTAGGYAIKMPDGQIYGIKSCTAEGTLTLVENYAGTTISGGSYYILPVAAAIAKLLNDVSTLLNSSNFSQLAGLSPNSGDFPEYLSGTWTTRSPTQVLLNLLNSLSETSIASASTCDIGASSTPKVQITGTTTITGFGSQTNALRYVRFGGALTLTHNATNLILLGAANRTTASGDVGIYLSDSSGHWREWAYFKADGTAITTSGQNYRTVDWVATSNVNISSGLTNGTSFDGGTFVTGQTILLANQTTGSQVGIYTIVVSGPASRSLDANTEALLPSGLLISVLRGTTGAGATYRHTTAPGFTLGSTSLTFAKFGLLDSSSGSGGQLKFPATQNDSSDPNTLDDYEEGTFTPTIAGTTSAGTGTYSEQYGYYTKIGNLVQFTAGFTWSAHTGTGNLVMSGLPFTVNSGVNIAPVNVIMLGVSLTASNVPSAAAQGGTTQVALRQCSTSGTPTFSTIPMDTAASLYVSGSYRV